MSDEEKKLPALEIIIDADAKSIAKSNFQLGEELADKIIAQTEITKDPYYALDSLMNIERINSITGIAKAKILHYLLSHWNDFGIQEPFVEVMQSYSGLSSANVIKRYINIWELFASDTIPPEYQEELKQKPINNLTPLISTLNAGYELEDKQWEEVIDADNNWQVQDAMRRVKGSEPTVRSLFYVFDKVSGILYAINQGKKYIVGRLIMTSQEDVVRRAIMRLLERLNVKIVEEVNGEYDE